MSAKAFIHLEASDPRHRQVIHAAIQARDTYAMNCLKGNLNKPIVFVLNWFHYAQMQTSCEPDSDCENDQDSMVILYSPQARLNLFRFFTKVDGTDYGPMNIPLDTYDFYHSGGADRLSTT